MITLLVVFYIVVSLLIGLSMVDRYDHPVLIFFMTVTWPIWVATIYLMIAWDATREIAQAANDLFRGD